MDDLWWVLLLIASAVLVVLWMSLSRHFSDDRKVLMAVGRGLDGTMASNILNILPYSFFILDRHQHYVFANEIALKTLQKTREDLIGKTPVEIGITATIADFFSSQVQAVLASGQKQAYTNVFEGANGAVAYDYVLYPLANPSGKVEFVACVANNVTPRRQAEEERDRLLDLSLDMIGIINADGCFKRVNPAFERVLGYGRDEILGHSLLEFVHDDDRRVTIQEMARLKKGLSILNFESRMRRKNGSYVWISWNLQPSGSSWYGMARDISKLKREQELLISSKEQAERETQTKSDLLAGVSHDIRTPLGSIIGYAELLREGRVSDSDQSRFADTIAQSGRQLSRLIDDILDFSKFEAGKLVLYKEKIRLQDILWEVDSLFRPPAASKGLKFEIRCEPSTPSEIVTDPTRLRQILFNLVSNAVKFTSKGKVVLHCRYVINETRRELEFAIEDTGRGLSPEEQSHLFEPYTQQSKGRGGTGLGLVLSRNLARALGGDVVVGNCQLGRGCTFIAKFEMAPPNEISQRSSKDPAHDEATTWDESKNRLTGLRALIVDDSEDNRFLVRHLLERQGVSVDTASDGSDGIKKALKEAYDIVLMDIQMPEKDGYEAVSELRRFGYERPVIALTAHAMPEEIIKAKSAGFNAHVKKPISRNELFRCISDQVPRA